MLLLINLDYPWRFSSPLQHRVYPPCLSWRHLVRQFKAGQAEVNRLNEGPSLTASRTAGSPQPVGSLYVSSSVDSLHKA